MTLGLSAPAAAGPNDAIVVRTQASGAQHQAPPPPDYELSSLAGRVDALIHEAVQDLGLSVDLSGSREVETSYDTLVSRAATDWVVSPRLLREGSRVLLEITVVPPGSSVLRVKAQEITASTLQKTLSLMMRDLVESNRQGPRPEPDLAPGPAHTVEPARSRGQAILALNATLMGGYVGYSLQRASGSEDRRLAYPLVAVGAGIGLGGSVLVAQEWDIGVGDAWLLSAGMWWPTASGLLIAESQDVPEQDRYAYGILAGLSGTSLTATMLAFGHVSEGDAALSHSGGAFGLLLGGVTELLIDGTTDETPWFGMGSGAGIGVVLAAGLSTQVQVPAPRMLLIDLGASLGAMTGAAAASPLLFVDEEDRDPTRERLWLLSVATGTLAGGAVAFWMTGDPSGAGSLQEPGAYPELGIIGVGPEGPVYGAGLRGTW